MKKSTIWLLAIIMALTFTSLLFMQITYIENMVRMRNEQFSEAVKRSLYAVSSQLEQDETKRYLAEDIEENQKRLLSIERGGTSVTQQWSIVSADGSISTLNVQEFTFSLPEKVTVPKTNSGSSITNTYKNMQEVLKNQYLYQKGLLAKRYSQHTLHSKQPPHTGTCRYRNAVELPESRTKEQWSEHTVPIRHI